MTVGPHKGLDELAYPPPANDSVQPIVDPLINGDGQFLLHRSLPKHVLIHVS